MKSKSRLKNTVYTMTALGLKKNHLPSAFYVDKSLDR